MLSLQIIRVLSYILQLYASVSAQSPVYLAASCTAQTGDYFSITGGRNLLTELNGNLGHSLAILGMSVIGFSKHPVTLRMFGLILLLMVSVF